MVSKRCAMDPLPHPHPISSRTHRCSSRTCFLIIAQKPGFVPWKSFSTACDPDAETHLRRKRWTRKLSTGSAIMTTKKLSCDVTYWTRLREKIFLGIYLLLRESSIQTFTGGMVIIDEEVKIRSRTPIDYWA